MPLFILNIAAFETVCTMITIIKTINREYFRFPVFVMSDACVEEPRNTLRPLRRNSKMKYRSCSLRLSNNNITDLLDLLRPVSHFLAEPSHLAWLDLSFNKISHISEVMFLSPWFPCMLSRCLLLSFLFVAVNLQCLFFYCRFCVSCWNCVCCIFMATAFSFCQRWIGWVCFHIYTPSLCMEML